MPSRRRWLGVVAVCAFVLVCALPLTAHDRIREVGNVGPAFGITSAFDGHLLVADAGAGIVHVGRKKNALIVKLPGVTDMVQSGLFTLLATTGGGATPTSAKLWKVFLGKPTLMADLGAFEATVNPDPPEINPNPFDVAALPNGGALVADAGANALLIVDHKGNIDWIATLPNELVSTANIKLLANCPAGPPNFCNLPPMIPAQPVTASMTIGPDGYYYVGELKGFPAPTGASKVWRINPKARHAKCGTSPDCRVVASGFTSIIDLKFTSHNDLLIVELDEASWFPVEGGLGTPLGGTVNECGFNRHTGLFDDCEAIAMGLIQPIAVAVGPGRRLHVLTHALEPGAAEVVTLRP